MEIAKKRSVNDAKFVAREMLVQAQMKPCQHTERQQHDRPDRPAQTPAKVARIGGQGDVHAPQCQSHGAGQVHIVRSNARDVTLLDARTKNPMRHMHYDQRMKRKAALPKNDGQDQ